MPESKWKLKVEQLMACNCNWGCPCSFDAPPTYSKCETALAYRIAMGSYGRVALGGLKFILVAAWPKAIHLGHGRGVLFLDAQATGPRREALEAIATAKAGGPMNIYMSMMTEPPEVRTARIEFRFIGKRSRFRIGNRVRVEFEPMRNPVTGEDHFLIAKLPRPVPTAKDSGLELSTRLHCAHIIVPLPRGLPDDEPSRERGEQPVRPDQVDVERHFEPSTLRVREQPVRIVSVPHVRSCVGFPAVRGPQAYMESSDEREPHDSGLFHFDKVSLPTDHLACAQPDSAQIGVTVPKFRAPRVDLRKRGSKPLRHSEEHARRIRRW